MKPSLRNLPSTPKPGAGGDRSRLLRGSVWSVIAAMGARASTLVAMILVANYLDTSAFGMLGLIQSTVFMSGVFAGTGTGIAAMKLVAEHRDSNKPLAGQVIQSSLTMTAIMACAFAVALYVLAPWIASTVLLRPEMSRPLRIAAALLPLTALNMAQNGVLAGLEVFRMLAIANLVAGAASLPILLCAAFTGNLHVVIVGLSLAMFINCLIFQWAIRSAASHREIPLPVAWAVPSIPPALWKLAVPAVLFSMLTAPTDWTCFAILTRSENGLVEMGYFNAANQWFNVCRFVAQNLTVPLIPILAAVSAARGRGSADRVQGVIRQAMKMNLAAVVPVVAMGVIASPWIMKIYGADYASQWPTLVLLLLCAGAFTIQMPILRALHAAGRIWLTFALNLLWSCSYVLATLWLAGSGSRGLATARLVSYVIYAAVTLVVGYYVLRPKQEESDVSTVVQARTDGRAAA